MKIGIIGYGRLGQLIANFIKEDATVLIYDISDKEKEVEADGHEWKSLEEVCSCPIVIPFVPISEFEKTIISIKDFLNQDSLIIDVCSVKEYPVKIMQEHLSDKVQILATHPMFGPDSAQKTVFGQKIVISNISVNESNYKNIKGYLEGHGLKVIEATPQEHDQQISHSLLLTHFIGRTLLGTDSRRLEIETLGYKRLMKILSTVENDSYQLFEDMNKYNRFAKDTRETFIKAMQKINGALE